MSPPGASGDAERAHVKGIRTRISFNETPLGFFMPHLSIAWVNSWKRGLPSPGRQSRP